MASSTLSSINNCTTTTITNRFLFFKCRNESKRNLQSVKFSRIRASSENSEDCNDEECAPDKEVGKVSMEWVAEERTKVVGTFPPRRRGWTGYVEKDTAGQTNIYSVEPAVYVAESAISSGTAGSSADGSENTAAIAAGLGLIFVAAASSILLQVSKNSPPEVQTVEYSGPSLGYYISKFKPPEIVQASVPADTISVQPENAASVPAETIPLQPESTTPEVPEVQTQAALSDTSASSSESS